MAYCLVTKDVVSRRDFQMSRPIVREFGMNVSSLVSSRPVSSIVSSRLVSVSGLQRLVHKCAIHVFFLTWNIQQLVESQCEWHCWLRTNNILSVSANKQWCSSSTKEIQGVTVPRQSQNISSQTSWYRSKPTRCGCSRRIPKTNSCWVIQQYILVYLHK